MLLRSGLRKILGLEEETNDSEQYNEQNLENESIEEEEEDEEYDLASDKTVSGLFDDDDINLENIFEDNLNLNENNMAANANLTFLQTAGQILPGIYNGDPLGLEAFIASVNLLNSVVAGDQADLLMNFVKSKLSGKALECISQADNTTELIIASLRRGIKPECSKVVEGRMIALRVDNKTVQDYARKAEDLADAFKRSLVFEGITQQKAMEMAIDKTVEMCRANAKSENVDAILGSKAFHSPKEVVASFIVESSKVQNKQVLAFGHRPNTNNNRGHNFRGGFNNRYNNGRPRNYNSNHNTNFNQNYRQNQQNNGQQNWRGQPNRRFNFHRGNSNGNRGNSNGNFNGNQNIRYAEASQPATQQNEPVQQTRFLGFPNPNNQ